MESMKGFVPLLNRVLVRPLEQSGALGSVLIPVGIQSAVKIGIVEAVGSGCHSPKNGDTPPLVRAGDKVMLPEGAGITIKRENKDYILLRDDELLGMFRD